MEKPSGLVRSAWLPACLGILAAAGCQDGKFGFRIPRMLPQSQEPAETKVPEPIHLLLPKSVRFHQFTGARTFDKTGGVKGMDVQIQALDACGDATKAFGKFQFALHHYRPGKADTRGPRIATWEEDLLEPTKNLVHWKEEWRTYQFKLEWSRAIPVGSKFILVVTFSSPFTERKFAERVFTAGE